MLGTGFVLGSIRIPFLVPRLGERYAELLEMPIMFFVVVIAARYVVRRFCLPSTAFTRLLVGFAALAMTVIAELLLVALLQDVSVKEYIASRDPLSGSVYLFVLLLFAFMPYILSLSSDSKVPVVPMRHATKPASLLPAVAGHALAFLSIAYGIVLVVGLLTRPSTDDPIQNPCFTLMEVLILAIAPLMVAVTVGVHEFASAEYKSFGLLGVVFMSMCAVLTCSVHFAVLTLKSQPTFASAAWAPQIFYFAWPSVVYALDILAWDFFFPIGVLFAALAVRVTRAGRVPRGLLFGSSGLAFFGLAGVPLANMNIRNIGIIGYLVLFPIAAVILADTFKSTVSKGDP